MASLRRKPHCRYWYACYKLPDGTRTQRSTRLTDRKAALKLADSLEEAARKRISEAQARRLLSDIHEQIHGSPLSSLTVRAFTAQWKARKSVEVAAVTMAVYQSAVDEFTGFLGERADLQIHYITSADVAAYRDKSAKLSSARTANNKLKIIRTLFQSAWRDGLITENPAAKVPALRTMTTARRPFTMPELKTLLATASDEWRGMIIAGLYTGQRLKDIASLTWHNVDLTAGELRLTTSKTRLRSVIPLAAPLRSHLEKMTSSDTPGAPLFPSAYRIATKNRDTSALSQGFHELLVAAGFATVRPSKASSHGSGRSAARILSPITFHSLRHTATSLLKNAGVSAVVAMDLVGHQSEAISQHYTHVDDATKRAAIALLPDVTC